MRRALTCFLVATFLGWPSRAAERKSWNHVRYVGGTVGVKSSRYDWNTTLTVTADAIVVEIAPATVFAAEKTVRIKPAQVVSLSSDDAAWARVAAVAGSQLPAKRPALFGMLKDSDFLGVVYETGGKRAALLLETPLSGTILQILSRVTGKPIENAP